MSAWRVTSAPTSPGTCCSPTASRLRGVALPCAMAAAMVRPRTHILSVSGDGGFLFSAQAAPGRGGWKYGRLVGRQDTSSLHGRP
ncbi:thiamine pyrophosphate-dependent enzyme [Streptomyces sp. NPDC006875]|uniref:thiamine pyrophosphate-dependent enzyme n=1 Tax=Streptomyces sp. NPDC006875 TaxID=3154781 RepID=UPI0033C4BC89